MPIDTSEPRSPGWWLAKLLRELAERQPRYDRLDAYMRGDPPLPQGPESSVEAWRRFQQKARTNFAALIVDAVLDRMEIVGFRTGADGDENGDDEAWRIFQANHLDADSELVHKTQLGLGDAYTIVGPPDRTGVPVITPEDPRQVYAVHDPVRRRQAIAAVKVFADDIEDVDVAYLYLPGRVYRAHRRRQSSYNPGLDFSGWEWDERGFGILPGDVVPVVRFPNRMDLLTGTSLGEFEDVIDILDRINHMLLQRLVIATAQAHKQRAIKGLPTHTQGGEEIDYSGVFPMEPGSLWALPDDAEVWESGQVDLTSILSAVRHDVQDLAAVTRTPLFYLTPDAAQGSAEGASLAREGLIFKARDRIAPASTSWRQTMSHAFLFAGDTVRASMVDLEAIWSPPERHSLAERFDAATKAKAVDVPWRSIMSDVLQFSPQHVARMEAERLMGALFDDSMLMAPPGAEPVGEGDGQGAVA